jgi:hypothetical protein
MLENKINKFKKTIVFYIHFTFFFFFNILFHFKQKF